MSSFETMSARDLTERLPLQTPDVRIEMSPLEGSRLLAL